MKRSFASPANVQDWLSSLKKRDIDLIRSNSFGGITLEKALTSEKQCEGFLRLIVVNEETQQKHQTSFVECPNCCKALVDNGGHLSRHREICKKAMNVMLPTTTTKKDVTAALSVYFAQSGRPLNQMEQETFRGLVEHLLCLG
uniref:Uncharacterized protein n=1 Tax=Caenorhabditis japonica TaxID=281687 RepID=A0A2Q4T003_CAEJA